MKLGVFFVRRRTAFPLVALCGLCLAGCTGGQNVGAVDAATGSDPSELEAIKKSARSHNEFTRAFHRIALGKGGCRRGRQFVGREAERTP